MADLKIVCDERGNVTITDLRTGREERATIAATDAARELVVEDKERLPGHFWGRLES